MTIRNRLKLIGLVPILLLVLLSSYFFITSYLNFEKANALKTVLSNNAHLSHSLTQIGKERGLSALYMGSNTKEFSAPLTKQRKNTDQALQALKTDLVTKDTSYIPFLLNVLGENTHLEQMLEHFQLLEKGQIRLMEISKKYFSMAIQKNYLIQYLPTSYR